MTIALMGVSVPNFWFGLVAILIFSVGLGWFPSGGFVSPLASPSGWLLSMFLPALTLGTATMGADLPASPARSCSSSSARTTCAPRTRRACRHLR